MSLTEKELNQILEKNKVELDTNVIGNIVSTFPEMLKCLILNYNKMCSYCNMINVFCDEKKGICTHKRKHKEVIEKITGMDVEFVASDSIALKIVEKSFKS